MHGRVELSHPYVPYSCNNFVMRKPYSRPRYSATSQPAECYLPREMRDNDHPCHRDACKTACCLATPEHATVAAEHRFSPVRRSRRPGQPAWDRFRSSYPPGGRKRSRGGVLCNVACEVVVYRVRNEPTGEPTDTGPWMERSLVSLGLPTDWLSTYAAQLGLNGPRYSI